MKLSVIIVNYNTTRLLQQCVESIVCHTHGVSYEIIVVDNHSSEKELTPLRKDCRITLIELQENLGFGRANNAGAAHAKGEHLLLLNPDTILVNDAITILYQHLLSTPSTGLCGVSIPNIILFFIFIPWAKIVIIFDTAKDYWKYFRQNLTTVGDSDPLFC